ncbi:MAG: 1-acyl-sn-glycerol-3-phosphate acyltransferase [Acidobacteria bacterium]|nr:1-acyl-sn-glycerol-3-phosphate acyltransferase [Acidobacteriota bacterium]MBI3656211.1 1-acyl-sn-glycerol-3-phosphate acyltransferase [Acidobacteriota bacterium]
MRIRGVPQTQATIQFGSIVVVTGFVGTFAGGWLGDYGLRYTKQSYLWISGLATLAAAPLVWVVFVARSPLLYFSAMVVAEILIFASTGPINSALINLVEPGKRAAAVAACNFSIHLFGDVPSPPLIGAISDKLSLEKGVLLVPIAILVGGSVWIYTALRLGGHTEWRLTRRVFRALFNLVLRIFFRRIAVTGSERVPQTGPTIIVLNHPNGLIDPLFILCLAPRPVSFLAKAPLFRMPIIGHLVRAFDSLPVYRQMDEPAQGSRNLDTFALARDLLARGGSLALFPEGVSHSDPRLRPLKTGAARIALGVAAAHDAPSDSPTFSLPRSAKAEPDTAPPISRPLQIIPAGLYYTAKGTFRSAALLGFGEPITVVPSPLGPDGEPLREPVEELTGRIERGLAEVTLQAEHVETLSFIARAERIFSAVSDASAQPHALIGEFELRRRFLRGYAHLRAQAPERLAALEAKIDRYEADLEHAGLNPRATAPEAFRWPVVIRYVAKNLFLFAVLMPPAVLGWLIHYPAYRMSGFFFRSFVKGRG